MSLDLSYFSFTSPSNIVCSEHSILVYGPDAASGSSSTTNNIAILNSEHLDNPFKRVLIILKAQVVSGLVI